MVYRLGQRVRPGFRTMKIVSLGLLSILLLGTLATAAFILELDNRLSNLAAPASDEIGLSLDERRLPQRIHRPRS